MRCVDVFEEELFASLRGETSHAVGMSSLILQYQRSNGTSVFAMFYIYNFV